MLQKVNSHFKSDSTIHNGTLLPIKNNLINTDNNTKFLAHYNISHNDIINNTKPYNACYDNLIIDHFDFNNIYKRDIVRDGLLVNLEADKASYGNKPGSSVNKATTIWHDDSGNNLHSNLVTMAHDSLNCFSSETDVNFLKCNSNKMWIYANKENQFNTSEITYEALIRVTGVVSENMTIAYGVDTGVNNTHYFSLNNKLKVLTYWYGKYSQGYHSSNKSLTFNSWHHVAVTWSKGDLNKEYVRFYIDGILDNEITINQFKDGNQGVDIMVLLQEGSRQFKGDINAFRFYNRALSASEIRNNYLKGMTSLSGVKNSHDSGAPMLLINNPVKSFGHNGSGVQFNGLNEYGYYKSKAYDVNNSFFTRFSTDGIVDNTELFTQGDNERGLKVSSNALTFYAKNGLGSIVECTKTTPNIPLNTFNNVVCTQTKDELKLYMNNIEVASTTIDMDKLTSKTPSFGALTGTYGTSSMTVLDGVYTVTINRNLVGTGNAYPNVKFPVYNFITGREYTIRLDVRLISKSGSATAHVRSSGVDNDYWTTGRQSTYFNTFTVGEWKTIELTRTLPSTFTKSDLTVWNTTPKIEIYCDIHNQGDAITFEFKNPKVIGCEYSENIVVSKNCKSNISEFATYNKALTFDEVKQISNSNVSSINKAIFTENYDFESNLVGHWPLHNDYNDISSNGLNLTLENSGSSFVLIDKIEGMKFKGASLSVPYSDKTDMEGEFTISCFFNTSSKTSYQHFLCIGNNTSESCDFMLGLYNQKLYAKVATRASDGTVVNVNVLSGNKLIEDNKWYHAVCTFDGKMIKVYLDGTLDNEQVLGVGRFNTRRTANPIRIGSERGADNLMNGVLSDVRLYSRALAHEEIVKLSKNKYLLNNNEYKMGGNLQVDPATTNLTIGGELNVFE